MRVALVAGETSGDLLGAGLIRSLKQSCPNIEFEGVAGPQMQAAGCKALEISDTLAVMGLIEPLIKIPKLLKLRRRLITRWKHTKPDVVVGIDSPEFNLGLEAALRSTGIRTVHYVSPSIWAWRKGRVNNVEKAADKVLCLLPFEKQIYDSQGIDADFVGHPLADKLPIEPDVFAARKQLAIDAKHVVAILPGSRDSEVSRLGPVFAETCLLLTQRFPSIIFVAPMVNSRIRVAFEKHLDSYKIRDRVLLVDSNAELAITAADIVLLASGTAALEAALLGTPMVAAYRVSPLTFGLMRGLNLLKVPYITLPNLLTEKPLVPEFIQHAAMADLLCTSLEDLLKDNDRRLTIVREFKLIRKLLARNADERAARAVLKIAQR
ncbi:MAG: lipid-A-disaccharide synthase [Woeseia sp.]|nr:lipid-A-disaccharide synthase [Woeseia sp.]|tara:strand:+ start:400 stop:1536 length:1137 start_codon:yes stop_codon:yes gene_type:complete